MTAGPSSSSLPRPAAAGVRLTTSMLSDRAKGWPESIRANGSPEAKILAEVVFATISRSGLQRTRNLAHPADINFMTRGQINGGGGELHVVLTQGLGGLDWRQIAFKPFDAAQPLMHEVFAPTETEASQNAETGNGKGVDHSAGSEGMPPYTGRPALRSAEEDTAVAGARSLQLATPPVARPERWTLDEIMRQQPANASFPAKKSQLIGLGRWLSTNHSMSFEEFANSPRQTVKVLADQFGEVHGALALRTALRVVDLYD